MTTPPPTPPTSPFGDDKAPCNLPDDGLKSWDPDQSELFADARPIAPQDMPSDILQSWDPEQSRILASFSDGDDARKLVQGTDRTNVIENSDTPAQPNLTEHDKLTYVKKIGVGGFGEVWEAVQERLGRPVAVKLVRSDLAKTKNITDSRHNFVDMNIRQEAYTAASLDHPNIVPVYDLQNDERGFPALAMKLVRGNSWEDVIKQDFFTLTSDEFLTKHIPILIGVSQAVAFAHSRGVVHRDLKPSQVMVGEFGEVLLMDWGLGVVFDPIALEKATQAAPKEIMATLQSASCPAGTLSYMAPEQTDPTAARIGPWTDVYLLGGILYNLMTGSLPHGTGPAVELYQRAKEGLIIPLKDVSLDLQLSPELTDICMRALAKEPADRYQTAKEFLDAILAYQSGSGRRRQSREFTKSTRELFATANGDYCILTKCEQSIHRARDLWPENTAAHDLSQEIIRAFSEAALKRGDLTLAAIHCDRIENETYRKAIADRIQTAQIRNNRRDRQRRVATLASIISLLIIVVGAVILNRTVSQAASASQKAQSDAETLISDLQDKLYPELEETGQVALISTLGKPIDDYFQQVSKAAVTPASRLRHINTLLAVRRAESRLAHTTTAMELAQRALSLAAQLKDDYPAKSDFQAALATARCAVAEQMFQNGDHNTDAAAVAMQASEDLKALEKVTITNPVQMARTARASEDLAFLIFVLTGDSRSSYSLLERSMTLRENALKREPQNINFLDGMAYHYLRLGHYQIGVGALDQALKSLQSSVKIREKIRELEPLNVPNLREMAMARFWIGRAYERLGDTDNAFKSHNTALEQRKALLASNPNDVTLRWNFTISRAKIAELEMNRGNLTLAEKELSATLTILSEIPRGTAANRDFERALATTLLAHGQLRKQQGDTVTANGDWVKALEIFQRLEKSAPYDFYSLRSYAEVLLELDRLPEVEKVVEKLRKLGYKAGGLSAKLKAKGLAPL